MNRLAIGKFVIISVSAFLFVTGCEHEPLTSPLVEENAGDNGSGNGGTNPPPPPPPQSTCDPDTIYFSQDILPFLISNCAKSGCHDSGTAQDGIILDSYANVMSTADVEPYDLSSGDLFEVITESDPDDRMPPPPNNSLSSQQINMIETWIMQGAKDLTCSNNTCDSTGVSFSNEVQPVIQNKCVGCHSGPAAGGGIQLNNYSNIAAAAQTGKLIGAITHTPGYPAMPQNSAMLPSCEIAVIRNWVSEGIQNN